MIPGRNLRAPSLFGVFSVFGVPLSHASRSHTPSSGHDNRSCYHREPSRERHRGNALDETYLGFDFGLRRIGIAAGQRITASAGPVDTIPARDGEPDWPRLDAIIAEWRPAALVVGVPLLTDGGEQPLARRARRFASVLASRYGLAVHEADERLSSRAAREMIADSRAAGTRRRTRKGDVDRMAATLILEGWLQAHTHDVD